MNETEKKLIDEALRLFGIENAECTMLRHNENITCKIWTSDKTYFLRIHNPVEDFNIRTRKVIALYSGDCGKAAKKSTTKMRNSSSP